MAKIAKGLARAALNFVVVGLGLPYLLERFYPEISKYVALPPPEEVWVALLAIGAAFALTGFLQNAYSKGDYPWLSGKLGSGLVDVALFTYAYSLLPSAIGSGSGGKESMDLLYLVYLAIALSYGYLVLDFFDARRKRRGLGRQTAGVTEVVVLGR